MVNSLKVKPFPGTQRLAPVNIEGRSMDSALRDEQFGYELMLLDLKTEFVAREEKLRAEHFARVDTIRNGDA
jgi:hypothetical protein